MSHGSVLLARCVALLACVAAVPLQVFDQYGPCCEEGKEDEDDSSLLFTLHLQEGSEMLWTLVAFDDEKFKIFIQHQGETGFYQCCEPGSPVPLHDRDIIHVCDVIEVENVCLDAHNTSNTIFPATFRALSGEWPDAAEDKD